MMQKLQPFLEAKPLYYDEIDLERLEELFGPGERREDQLRRRDLRQRRQQERQPVQLHPTYVKQGQARPEPESEPETTPAS